MVLLLAMTHLVGCRRLLLVLSIFMTWKLWWGWPGFGDEPVKVLFFFFNIMMFRCLLFILFRGFYICLNGFKVFGFFTRPQ